MGMCVMPRRLAGVLIAVLALSACTDWLGDNKPPPLPGKRISILSQEKVAEPEISGPVAKIVLPPPEDNEDWPQAGGYSNHAMHHMMVSDSLERRWSSDAGTGSGKRRKLLARFVFTPLSGQLCPTCTRSREEARISPCNHRT